MKKLTLAATALAVAAVLAGCGRHDDNAASTASTASSALPTSPSTSDNSTGIATAASSSGSSAGTDASSSGSTTASMGAGSSGQTVYSTTCAVCHAAGVTGAPKPGDKSDWGPRIAQGQDTLYEHALKGFQGKKGVMPPKGGNTALADADVKSAVDFMVSQSK